MPTPKKSPSNRPTRRRADALAPCAVQGCAKTAQVKGLCKAHNMREWRIKEAIAAFDAKAAQQLVAFETKLSKLTGHNAERRRELLRGRMQASIDARRAALEQKLDGWRAKLGDKVAVRAETEQQYESVTVRLSKSAAKRLYQQFPSLYTGVRDIVENWALTA